MAKYLLFAALAGSASAFAPASVANTKTSVNAFADGMIGSEGPEPMPFSTGGTSKEFDPIGFATVRTSTRLTRVIVFLRYLFSQTLLFLTFLACSGMASLVP